MRNHLLGITLITLTSSLINPSRIQADETLANKPVAWAAESAPQEDRQKSVLHLRGKRSNPPLKGYLHTEEVTWSNYGDGDVVALADGRQLAVDTNGLDQEEIGAWSKGKKMFLCYDETKGCTLLEPKSGITMRVRGIDNWDKNGKVTHPIDGYIASLNASSTYEMESVNLEAIRLWRLEIDRAVREVISFKHLPAKIRSNFIDLSNTRLEYCRQQCEFGDSSIGATVTGTAGGPMSGNYAERIYRDAYLQLSALADSYASFKHATGE